MIEIAKCIMHIGSVPGRNDKIALLKRYADVPGFKEILQFIYNPYVRTGIAAAKLKKAKVYTGPTITWNDVIEYFTNNQTGSDKDASFAKSFVVQFEGDRDSYDLAVGMVTKNLKIGITDKTLNKVYGDDFIPRIGIMKGENWKDYGHKVKGPFIITEKLDGARRILVKENGNVTLYSRSGIPDDGLVDIEAEAKHLPDNTVYDGELLAIGEFQDSIALRQATNSIANSKGKRTGLTFNIFDAIPVDEFKQGISTNTALERKLLVGSMFRDTSISCLTPLMGEMHRTFGLDYAFKFIKPVPILGVANSEEEILAFALPIWERRFEGVMVNTFRGYYDITKDRSRDLLKVKKTTEYILRVIDIEEGTNKNEGKVGALILDYKGNRVGCGSGLTDQQREAWWAMPNLIVGKRVEIESFGETTNQAGGISLNCPIFKRIVGVVE